MINDFVIKHILKIKTLPLFMNCPLFITIERNLAIEHKHLATSIQERNIPKVFLYHDPNDKKLGFRTTNKTKATGVQDVYHMLTMGSLILSDNFFTTSKGEDGIELTSDEMLDFFCKQLINYEKKIIIKPGKKETTIKYSGKGDRKFDDLVSSLLINVIATPIIAEIKNVRYL